MLLPRGSLFSAALLAAGLALGPGIAQAQTRTVNINDVTVTEGQQATFTVSLSSASTRRIRVNYATANGTAVAPGDYTSRSGRLEFAPGVTSLPVQITTINNTVAEPTETFQVRLSNPDRVTIGDGTGVGTILDNDGQATVTITGPAAAINEGGTLAYLISRTGSTAAALTVNITVGGTASAQQPDYNPIPTTVTIPAGQASATLNVVTIDDAVAEAAETVIISLGNGTGYTVGVPGSATGNINANDQAGNPTVTITGPTAAVNEGGTLTYTVRRAAAAATALPVNFTVGGTATAGADFTSPGTTVTIPANLALVNVVVATIDDAAPEPAETIVLTLATGTGYVIGAPGSATGTINPSDQAAPNQSINSTSQNSTFPIVTTLPEVARVANTTHSVLAINDLGMHCGDLDTRVASILPPFQVLLTQVVQKGATPVLNPGGVTVHYSAAQNPVDPILSSATFAGRMDDGKSYKTNFWATVARGAYDPFYPASFGGQQLTPLSGPPFNVTADVGLPVPNVENFYINAAGQVVLPNTGNLTAVQHRMPGITNPYFANAPQRALEHYRDKPFFVGFQFGYVAADVNWWEAAGPPFAAFDDYGRQNAYPLVRVEARTGHNPDIPTSGTTISTVDTVLPISGEASCVNCHATDGQTTRSTQAATTLTNAGLPVFTQLNDPDGNMPPSVSIEYGGDVNILRLHDLKHGSKYVSPTGTADACAIGGTAGVNGTASCLTHKALVDNRPVVCQVCHYTPALDLAHLGPLAGAVGTVANGRNQLAHQSNSRVMHNHHGQFTTLFPSIDPPVVNATTGAITNQATRLAQLENSCYQCHPGKDVKCLRGAMFNGAMLCNDCHGNMTQVGDDFSRNITTTNPGAFILGQGNFYDPANTTQPRVPWANEPGCGSCHTGDVNSNQANIAGGIRNVRDVNGVSDTIRLRQAFRTGDTKATPIVPTNKRFAEPAVPTSFGTFNNPGAGNPKLYRVSTGHGGVMCEGCHGATHAEFPNANPNANDNVTANQLQGHTGPIIECATCHGTANLGNTMDGPHGMHPVGSNTSFANGGHRNAISGNNCVACHGPNATSGGRSQNTGTVLSRAAAARTLEGTNVARGQPVGCTVCH